MLNIGIKAAREASKVIIQNLDQVDLLEIETKGRNDFVTEVDKQAEQAIIDVIQYAYPDHAILAEESGKQGENKEHEWIIDPLDGTTNFLHGYPVFAISIALRIKGILEVAVVYDPTREEMFTASRGKGAHLNNRRIRVSQTRTFANSLLGTGFPFKEMKYMAPWLKSFEMLMPHVSGVRRAGSAAIDLAQLACGRFDGFWEYGLQPWDMAAGILLVQEAGGLVSDMQGKQEMLETGHIVCANPKIFKKLQTIVKEHAKALD